MGTGSNPGGSTFHPANQNRPYEKLFSVLSALSFASVSTSKNNGTNVGISASLCSLEQSSLNSPQNKEFPLPPTWRQDHLCFKTYFTYSIEVNTPNNLMGWKAIIPCPNKKTEMKRTFACSNSNRERQNMSLKAKTVLLQLLNCWKSSSMDGKVHNTVSDTQWCWENTAAAAAMCFKNLITTDLDDTKRSFPASVFTSTGELWGDPSTPHNPWLPGNGKNIHIVYFTYQKDFNFTLYWILEMPPFNPVFILNQYKNFNIP